MYEKGDQQMDAKTAARDELLAALNTWLTTDEHLTIDPDVEFDPEWLDGFRKAMNLISAHQFKEA